MATNALNDGLGVAEAALEAHTSHDWQTFAELVHPRSLERFREQQLKLARPWPGTPTSVLHATGMPPAVVEYVRVLQAEAFAGRSDPFLNCFSGVASFAELEELSPAALLISYLQHKEPDRPNDGGPAFPRRTRSTIGAIAEDDTTLHVVYRLWTDAGAYGLTDSVELMSVSRTANKWMIMLNRDLLQMGYAIIERDTVEP